MAEGGLTGNYRVRVFRPAFADACKWLPRTRDRIELRRHSLKLRYWPQQNPEDEHGRLLDLDWSWIKACKGLDVGELRINDTIGGHDNLRVIFYRGRPQAPPTLPIIWIIAVFQKKRNDFTDAQIQVFKARRVLVIERFYRHKPL
jgi:hypothetical protein